MADLFHYRTLTAAINQIQPSPRLLYDTLLKGKEDVFAGKTIEFDLEISEPVLAPFVERESPAVPTKSTNYKHYEIEPPTIKFKDPLAYDSAWTQRLPGDSLEGPAKDVLRRKIARIQARQKDRIYNSIEYMAAQLLLTGKIVYNGEHTSFSFDFQIPDVNKVTSDWSDPSTSTPLKDLRKWKKLVERQIGFTPNVAFMTPDAVDAFLASEEVKEKLDNRRMDFGSVAIKGSYIGRLLGIDIYEFDETVKGEDGSEIKLQGSTPKVCLTVPNVWKPLFASAFVENGPYPAEIFSDSWESKDPRGRIILAESHPLPIITHAPGIVIAEITV